MKGAGPVLLARLLVALSLAGLAALPVATAYAQEGGQFVCNIRGFNVGPSSSVPIGQYLLAGAGLVAMSFVGVRLFSSQLAGLGGSGEPRFNLLSRRQARFVLGPSVVWPLKAVVLGILVVTVASALIGRSLLPATVVWLYFGAGLAIVSALVGNIWLALNPWKTAYELLERRFPPLQGAAREWPAEFGLWPAVALFAAFRWVELAYPERTDGKTLALLIITYSVITLGAMWYYGKHTWLRYGDPFSVFFRLLSSLSATEVRVRHCEECEVCDCACESDQPCIDCYECFELAGDDQKEINLRPVGAGLQGFRWSEPGEVPFILFIFSWLAFAGLRVSRPWGDIADSLGLATTGQYVAFDSAGLLGLFAAALMTHAMISFLLGVLAESSDEGEEAATGIVHALLPVAAAFMLAYYLRFLLMEGQRIVPLASDPFWLGWDLFGTAGYRVDLDVPEAVHLWSLQVGSLFLGGFLSVYLVYRIVFRSLAGRWGALWDQIPATALSGGYMMFSLWLLWTGIPSKDC